jgi:hypothetical protein
VCERCTGERDRSDEASSALGKRANFIPVSTLPLWKGYPLTFHDVGLILCATFTALAVGTAFFLIWRHATHYSKLYEQKQYVSTLGIAGIAYADNGSIIRILFMVPIYATVSLFSYYMYHGAVYFEVLRDCYEAFAIASFFTLLCHYVAPNLHEQKQYFRNIEPKNWIWPLCWFQRCTEGEHKGFLRKPRSGLTWFNVGRITYISVSLLTRGRLSG